MTEINAVPYELTVGAEPPASPQVGLNQRRMLLDVQNKSTAAAVVYVKLGAPFTQNAIAVQTISFGATPDAGTWKVTDSSGNQTAALAANINAADLQTALQGLVGIGSGNVTVTGAMPAFTLTYAGTLANKPVDPITIQSSLTLSTGQANAVQTIAFSAPPEAGTLSVTDWGGNTVSGLTAATLTAAELKVAINSLVQVNGGVATVTQDPVTKNFTVTFGTTWADRPVPVLTVIGTGLTNSDSLVIATWTVAAAPAPAAGTLCLSYGADVTTPLAYNAAASAVQAALEALPGIGAGNVLVTGASFAAGFTLALRSGLANIAGLPFGRCNNFLSRLSNAPAGVKLGDVAVRVTQTVAGSGIVPVTVNCATTTAGVAPTPVAASFAVTTPGVTKPTAEGYAIAAGQHKEWGLGEAPIDTVYIVASVDNTPVLVVEG